MSDTATAAAAETEQLKAAFALLLDKGLTQGDVLRVLHERTELAGVDKEKAEKVAAHRYTFSPDSDTEIGIDAYPIFSQGNDGIWVGAWVFVPNEDLGIGKPLPDELQGKVWRVNARDAHEIAVTAIGSMTEAVNTFDDGLEENECFLKAGSEDEARTLASRILNAESWPNPMWIEDEDDPCYGFELYRADA